jgi:hypothetical protein
MRDILITWTWDSYHILAAVCGIAFIIGFGYIIWDSFIKDK